MCECYALKYISARMSYNAYVQKRALDPLKLDLWTVVVTHHVDAGM